MPIEMWVSLAVGLPVMGLCFYWLVKRQGQLEAQNDRLQENADARKEADRDMADIRNLSDDELSKRLRDSSR